MTTTIEKGTGKFLLKTGGLKSSVKTQSKQNCLQNKFDIHDEFWGHNNFKLVNSAFSFVPDFFSSLNLFLFSITYKITTIYNNWLKKKTDKLI